MDMAVSFMTANTLVSAHLVHTSHINERRSDRASRSQHSAHERPPSTVTAVDRLVDGPRAEISHAAQRWEDSSYASSSAVRVISVSMHGVAQQEVRHLPENADIGAAESSKSRPPCFS